MFTPLEEPPGVLGSEELGELTTEGGHHESVEIWCGLD